MTVASPSNASRSAQAVVEPATGRRIDLDRVRRTVAGARRDGRSTLLEPEGLEVLDAIGLAVPDWVFVPIECLNAGGGIAPRDLAGLHGDRVVVKVVGASIAHKTELGGVAEVERDTMAVTAEMRDMVERLAAERPAGCLAASYVEHEPSLVGELLVALRWTADFGPIVAVGGGGVLAERLAAELRPGAGLAIVSAEARDEHEIEA
ncbi:MAG TPA: acetate--CoA ligase family protein, partial [Candidatus Binatus sp.]|nr:acetate--CoA ligase family protein [Candidatus Binatus sp.]